MNQILHVIPVSRRTVTDRPLNPRCSTIVNQQSGEQTKHSMNIQHAMAAVDKGETIHSASKKLGIPHYTLHDRVSGKVKGSRHGPAFYLMEEEEEKLTNFLILCADIGYAHSLSQVLALVQNTISFKELTKW